MLAVSPKIFDYQAFTQALDKAKTILVLGDNAGEAVFDRFLLEKIKEKHRIIYAVREEPVINDMTLGEVRAARIDEVAEVISSGTKAPGTILSKCDDGFKEIFRKTDMVISKGQGNYEALSDEKREVFFLLKAKCPVIARDIGTEIGDPVLLFKGKDERNEQCKSH